MKNIFYALSVVFIVSSLVWAATTYTTNYNLAKPGVGDTGWGSAVNSNFDTIDSQMKTNANATATSAGLASALSNETGTGSVVFSNSPTMTTPNIGSATGSISGNAGTATALAANGANCSAGEYPLGVDASGAVESCTDATTEISSAISALSSVYQPLEATLTDIADGTITEDLVNTANPWADNEVADTITASNYLPMAGGVLTGEVTVDDLGLEFTAGDALSNCSTFSATGGGIFYDDSEGKFKKCQDNTLTDLDTGGSETNNLETIATGIAVNEVPTGTAADTVVYKLLPDCNVAGSALNYEDSTQTWSCRSGLGGGSFDSTTVDSTTWSDNANASNVWTFDVSGTDHTMTMGNGLVTFSHGVTVSGALTATLTGNASTATALAANGSNCSAGSAPLGVDASGASESCTDYEEDLSNSAGLLAALSDETGTGVAVFSTTPTLVTPVLGVATATSINKVAITAPATGATLTIADGATLTASATATVSGTNTGDQTTVSGNAGTVTFADAGGDTTTFVALGTAATGSLAPATDAGLSYNATTNALTASGTIEGGTLTEGGNAIYNSTETPGGELGGTWASPTIDDSVTVTGWVMGASTATTPSADDNDTSLATTAYVQTEINAMGGRSLTASSGSMDADVELYTSTKCVYIEDPVAADDLKSIWINDSANGFTLTKLWCESDQTATLMLQVDDGTPADVDSVDLACISTPDTDTSLDGDATMAAGDRLDLDVASVSGTPTWVSICWTGTYDD